ncbi:MAG: isoprenyl transferase [Hyphomicrobiaceae bacterium]|nr:isoprenyl transferase [Hyphomicrobiaceae bacterium]
MAEVSAQQSCEPPASGVPRHVAIIMDGNGRWAAARGLPRALGHRMGVEAVRRTVRASIECGVRYLTIYSFSSENWSRPAREIADLMGLMKRYIRRDLGELHRTGVSIRMIGDRRGMDQELLALVSEAEALTADNSVLTLVIAFNYGARDELVRATKRLAERIAAGELVSAEISEALLEAELDTHDIPDPDLLIRTSGELRLSNFLLWQCAYTEFVFLDEHWPDFGRKQLDRAISLYAARERRFGGLTKRSRA